MSWVVLRLRSQNRVRKIVGCARDRRQTVQHGVCGEIRAKRPPGLWHLNRSFKESYRESYKEETTWGITDS